MWVRRPIADHRVMSDIAPNTPSFAPASTADPEPDPWEIRHPALFVAASIVVGLTAAALIGTSTGLLVYSGAAASCHNDGWCELGAAIYGLAAGSLAALAAHVVAGIVFVQRHLPPGRRTAPIVLHIGLPIFIYAVLLALAGL